MKRTLTILIAGIIIGLMIAPDKGSSTRKRLSDLFSGLPDNDEGDGFRSSASGSFPSGEENRTARNEQPF